MFLCELSEWIFLGQNLHQNQVLLPQHIHHGLLLTVYLRFYSRQQILGEVPPFRILPLAEIAQVCLVQIRCKGSQSAAQKLLVSAKGQNAVDHLLRQTIVPGSIQQPREVVAAFQHGLDFFVDPCDLILTLNGIPVSAQEVENIPFCDGSGPLAVNEQFVDHLLSKVVGQEVAIDTHRIQLVPKHILAIEQRILRQHRRSGIFTVANQVCHKCSRAIFQINDFFKIPGFDFCLLFPGKTDTPVVCVLFLPVVPLQRADVIGQPELEGLQNLFRNGIAVRVSRVQEGKVGGSVFQNRFQLPHLKLVRDQPVFNPAQLREKRAILDLLPDLRNLCLRPIRRKLLFQEFAEALLVAAIVPTLRLVPGVSREIIQLILSFVEKSALDFRAKYIDEALQRQQIGMILVVLSGFHFRNISAFFLTFPQNDAQSGRVKHIFQGKEQICVFFSQQIPERIPVFIQIVLEQDGCFSVLSRKLFQIREQLAEPDLRSSQQFANGIRGRLAFSCRNLTGSILDCLFLYGNEGVRFDRLHQFVGICGHNRQSILIIQIAHKRIPSLFYSQNFIRALSLIQKVPAIFQQMVDCQKNQPDIVGLIGIRQFSAQMIDRRIVSMVVLVCIGSVIEKGKLTAQLFIILPQVAFVQAIKKLLVDFADCFRKKRFQDHEALLSPLKSAAHGALGAPLSSCLRLREQSAAPHMLSMKTQNVVFRICDSPSHRICTYVKPDVISFLLHHIFLSIHIENPFLTGLFLYGIKNMVLYYHLGLHYKFK